jgi:hypothetical protein
MVSRCTVKSKAQTHPISIAAHHTFTKIKAEQIGNSLKMKIKGLTVENRLDMKKETKRLLSSIAVAAGTLGTALLVRKKVQSNGAANVNRWARPGMLVTFRAELMPGRDASERTYRVKTLLPSDRVLLDGVAGEHMKNEFERAR